MFRRGRQKKHLQSRQPHRDFLIALDGFLEGKKLREIAIDLFSPEHVNASWTDGDWLKSQVRRRIQRGRYFMNGGYMELLNRNL
jgi:hypothetical protein